MEPRQELSEFLRLRRARITPEAVGLPPGPRRRTPGLRREEVALLAGVSVSWYTWLEQGRPINASRSVLDALGRVLQLTPAEQEHFYSLARAGGAGPGAGPDAAADHLPPDALVRLIRTVDPIPAYVLAPNWDIVAWNAAQARLFPMLDQLDRQDCNLLWIVFAVPAARDLIVGWEREAATMVAQFRAAPSAGRDALVVRLAERSAEFAALWSRHEVEPFAARLRRYRHPAAGELIFEYQQLAPAEWPYLRVVLQLGVPGDDSVARLAAWHRVV